MKKLILAVAVLAITAPAALAAQGQTPAQACRGELNLVGAANFKSTYDPNGTGASAMGKCISKHQRSAAANRVSAAKACTAERAMSADTFKAAHTGKTFNEFYGLNENDRNAYGKCVSAKTEAANTAQQNALLRAERLCKQERGGTAETRAAFTATYGGKASAAFGKCVSSKNKPA